MDLGDVSVGDKVEVYFLEEGQRKYVGRGLITPLPRKGLKYNSVLVRQEEEVKGYRFRRKAARFNINGELVIPNPLEMQLDDIEKLDSFLESQGI